MLARLIIENYALIDSLDISFPEGLVIISGETGAGKSILIGALSLLSGVRADLSVLKDPAKNSIIEGEFLLSSDTKRRLSELAPDEFDLPIRDESVLVLRRIISSTGRSRSFINDEPVSNATMSSVSSLLIDIHSQHQTLILNDPEFQLSVLDHFAGNDSLVKEYRSVYDSSRELKNRVHTLDRELNSLKKESDYNNFIYNQLKDAALSDSELGELEEEYATLSNADEIKRVINSSLSELTPFDSSITGILRSVSINLAKITVYIPSISDIVNRLDSCRIELEDLEYELRKRDEQVEVSPERLERVNDRLSELYSLLKRHNVKEISDLIVIRDTLATGVANMEQLEEKLELTSKELKESETLMAGIANELHQKRSASLRELSADIRNRIRALEMPYAEFEIEQTKMQGYNELGSDKVAFLFSANGSDRLIEISKVASGGELSRIMLVLKSLIAKFATLPTMVFDEIDSGVSGRIADKMGDLIADLSRNVQIFAITHLPQIASKRGKHFLAFKKFNEKGVMSSYIEEIGPEERVNEVARMLSGARMSEAAIENARVLIKENNINTK